MARPEDRNYANQALRRLAVLILLFVVALGLTGVGVYLAYQKVDLALRGEIVWGEVIALEYEGVDPSKVLVVEFTPDGVRKVTIRHSESTRPTGLEVGARAPVNFLPEAPEDARILGRINWIPAVLLLLLGPTLIVLAIRGIRIEGRLATGDDDFEP